MKEQTVTWSDANGTQYIHTIKPRQEVKAPEISTKVTWTDGAGNTFVRDEAAQTVTVYDAEGYVIAVMHAGK